MNEPPNSNPASNPTIRIEKATGINPPRRGKQPPKQRAEWLNDSLRSMELRHKTK